MGEWAQTTAVSLPSRFSMVWALAWHDVRLIAKTPSILATVAMPVFMLLLFRVVFTGFDEQVIIPVRVYDPAGSRVTAVLQQIPRITVQQVVSEAALAEGGEEVLVRISVPPDFETAVANGSSPDLFITLYPQDGRQLELANFQQTFGEQLWASAARPPINLVWQQQPGSIITGENIVEQFLLIFMMLMTMGLVGNMLAVTMVEERNEHTLDSLLLSPASNVDVLAGKCIAGVLYSCVTAVILIPIAGASLAIWPLMALSILLGSLLLVGVGLLTGLIFETKIQCNSWGGLIMLLLLIPSWFLSLPLQLPWLEFTIRLMPTYYLIDLMLTAVQGNILLTQTVNNLVVVVLSIVLLGWVVQWRAKRPFPGRMA